MDSSSSCKKFNWPEAVLYTHPLTHQKIYKKFPSKNQSSNLTIGWFAKFLFDDNLPCELPFGFSILLNNIRINYQRFQFDSLFSFISQQANNYVLEPKILIGLPGGKGGFGSMLRAQGNRMNSKKASNNDACRDLSGRRLKSIRAAEKLAEYIEGESERKQAKKTKLINKITRGLKQPTDQKIRFEDHDYLKECDNLKSNVKDAVQQAVSLSGTQPSPSNKRSASIFDDDLTEEESEVSSEVSESEENDSQDEETES